MERVVYSQFKARPVNDGEAGPEILIPEGERVTLVRQDDLDVVLQWKTAQYRADSWEFFRHTHPIAWLE